MPELNWIGKSAVVKHHKEVPFRLLETDPELSCGEPDSGNLIVEGDNLHALKALLPRYAGKVKCIYIDPPYNTGNEGWVYNDNVKAPEIVKWLGETVGKEAEDLTRHDKWLCMMYPRLVLLKQFLAEDGAIFVSIDDNEVASLRLLMDEIFGRSKFIANILWQKRISPDGRVNLGDAHEFVICFCKADHNVFHKIPLSDEQIKNYKNPDNDPRGAWVSTDFTAQGHRPNQMYTIKTPGGEEYSPAEDRCWANIESEFIKLNNENRIWFGKDGKGRPRIKNFLAEHEGVRSWTWWQNSEVGNSQEGKKELNALFGMGHGFDTPKPTRLIQRILQIASNGPSLILDSFAGSGTTAHAVLKQNAVDGGDRKFILVEMESKIAQDITSERVRRVIEGYTDSKGKAVEGLGGGFQYCRLSAEPLFDAYGAIREDVSFAQLAEFVWFVETGTGYTAPKKPSPLLGVHDGRAIYLLYNGILSDRSDLGGNVLNQRTIDYLEHDFPHDGPKTIYGARSRYQPARLKAAQIEFKQLPYRISH
ncbi:MAG: site-specific DNA-methyltransferase [Puniceicoccaceae bacterium]|nr:site-specific DNA-methyltransferase [Puniceicoccaceae bacterium]|tara:strand:+ start:10335 stop:11933 length:1599 start_codon:yes stop_codon:yes gene_type:complete